MGFVVCVCVCVCFCVVCLVCFFLVGFLVVVSGGVLVGYGWGWLVFGLVFGLVFFCLLFLLFSSWLCVFRLFLYFVFLGGLGGRRIVWEKGDFCFFLMVSVFLGCFVFGERVVSFGCFSGRVVF